MKPLFSFALLVVWLLFGCGSFGPRPAPLSEVEILATADAIRTREANDLEREASADARAVERDDFMTKEEAAAEAAEWRMSIYDEADATVEAWIRATENAVQQATITAEAEIAATETYIDEILEEAEASYYATEEALLTEEAGEVPSGCPGGCVTYPSWCEPPIKGNVSFDDGERIYHMPNDEFYDETKINPDYDERYFCTPEEAEVAGFRRAHR